MMDEIESGNVGVCMEIMRESKTRLIAMNDGLDTINGEGDFTQFRIVAQLSIALNWIVGLANKPHKR